jgi:GNAT superfamily N-acetyltransferase
MTPITVTPMREEQLPAIVDLICAQQGRHYRLDPRLRGACSRAHIEATLLRLRPTHGAPLVALDREGRVRGYAQPDIWELEEQSLLHAFLSPKNGIARQFTLPDPSEPDAPEVAASLLRALSEAWHVHGATGDLMRWPAADRRIEPQLLAQGFRLDSVCAVREAYVKGRATVALPLSIRPAQAADEERLVALFEEELRAHEPYTPFVRSSPAVLASFRRKLARLFAGERVEEGAPSVLVAERDGSVVAMVHCTLVEIAPDEEPGLTPPGLYGCIDNLSVRAISRGQGIGRELVYAVFEAFTAAGLALDGYLLWYNPDNPLAGAFWPRLGFVPLWTTYQRLHL